MKSLILSALLLILSVIKNLESPYIICMGLFYDIYFKIEVLMSLILTSLMF